MKATIALLFVLVAAVSAQHYGGLGHGGMGHGGHGGHGGHRMGRSLVGGPVLVSRPLVHGVVARPIGLHHRLGRSVLLTAPVVPVAWRGGLMHSTLLAPRLLH